MTLRLASVYASMTMTDDLSHCVFGGLDRPQDARFAPPNLRSGDSLEGPSYMYCLRLLAPKDSHVFVSERNSCLSIQRVTQIRRGPLKPQATSDEPSPRQRTGPRAMAATGSRVMRGEVSLLSRARSCDTWSCLGPCFAWSSVLACRWVADFQRFCILLH